MKKYIIIAALVFVWAIAVIYITGSNKRKCPLTIATGVQNNKFLSKGIAELTINDAFAMLKQRRDNNALAVFERLLDAKADNLNALWGKAEVLRRARKYEESEKILNRILSLDPGHVSSLISLSYIKYKQDKLKDAVKLIKKVLATDCLDTDNKALAYMMLGSINSRRSEKGSIIGKLAYGTHIKGYFLKARELAPELPEVHLGLGTFYLLAPGIVGGDLDMAIAELKTAVDIAPDFATANARLAQAYKEIGDLKKYNFHIGRAKDLDPENEVLQELDTGIQQD